MHRADSYLGASRALGEALLRSCPCILWYASAIPPIKTELRNSEEVTNPQSYWIQTIAPKSSWTNGKFKSCSQNHRLNFKSDKTGMSQKMHMLNVFSMYFACIFEFEPMFINVPFESFVSVWLLGIPDTAMHWAEEGDINLSERQASGALREPAEGWRGDVI